MVESPYSYSEKPFLKTIAGLLHILHMWVSFACKVLACTFLSDNTAISSLSLSILHIRLYNWVVLITITIKNLFTMNLGIISQLDLCGDDVRIRLKLDVQHIMLGAYCL